MPFDAAAPRPTLAEVEALLHRSAAAPGVLGEAASHLLDGGGKRMRAALALEAAGALGVTRDAALAWAAACELVHQASLVHDDLQDGETSRRGRPPVHLRFGAPLAVGLGVHLLARATELASDVDAPGSGARLPALLARRVAEAGVAQAREFDPALWATVSPAEYEALVRAKAGALLSLAVEGPAMLAGLPDGRAAAAREAACHFGAAYQVADDLADLAPAGAPARGDLARGGLNAVLVRYLDAAPGRARRTALAVLRRPPDPGRAAALLAWRPRIQASGAPDACRIWFHDLMAAGRRQAALVPEPLRGVLAGLAARIAPPPTPEPSAPTLPGDDA